MIDASLHENYKALAAAIVEVACADYIDARIVAERGYMSEHKARKKLYDLIISYGERRYVWYDGKELRRGSERINKRKLETIKQYMPEKRKELAQYECKELEDFFRSDTFALFMPNTNVTWLLHVLRARARNNDRMTTSYSPKSHE